MATAHGAGGGAIKQGFVAGSVITQYRFVEQTDDDTCEQVGSDGDLVLGVAQERATSDDSDNSRVIDVMLQGLTVIELGDTISRGTRVRAGSDGRAIALAGATANQNQAGILLSGGIAGDWVTLLLTPGATADA
jgi:hypothetical protein